MKLPTQSQPIERTTYNSHSAGVGANASFAEIKTAKPAPVSAKKNAPSLLGKA
ncbi:hypothetical protein L2729_04320 [Shewanella gelidimarina]|uniref:hypothetical protein n=1 Tax=Shewanella gelidimarina TaxID=56813 RepID=UPI00200C46BD|nr:hypothetical protein [Shewanella gelidimarina]MCL1057218.1 hypothetical protein [Shewanella gelidimarina]